MKKEKKKAKSDLSVLKAENSKLKADNRKLKSMLKQVMTSWKSIDLMAADKCFKMWQQVNNMKLLS